MGVSGKEERDPKVIEGPNGSRILKKEQKNVKIHFRVKKPCYCNLPVAVNNSKYFFTLLCRKNFVCVAQVGHGAILGRLNGNVSQIAVRNVLEQMERG